ncbi:HTH_Tnp_Tc3_2 domain-containing protein [Trichonephila clavipes]|nr:HTH_Tnp_Tc3_2 domain-containing protein [Trichonephila clavipes]
MSFTRKPGSERSRQTSRREDRRIVRNARVQPTTSSAVIQAQVALSLGVPVSSRTIRRHLVEGQLGSRCVLPLTPPFGVVHIRVRFLRRSNSASEVLSPTPEDSPFAGASWIKDYIDDIRTGSCSQWISGGKKQQFRHLSSLPIEAKKLLKQLRTFAMYTGESTARKKFAKFKTADFEIDDTPRRGRPFEFDEDHLKTRFKEGVHHEPKKS